MTPKEKAQELYDKYFFPHYIWENDGYQVDEKLTYEVRKRFALIAVDEIIEVTAPYCDRYEPYYLELKAEMTQQYWRYVKQEIKKL